jgi:hypothetical protein
MATDNTPPAMKLFCVWADCDRRVYQHVEATGPEDAYRIAKESPGDWEFCAEHEDDCYRLSDDVLDLDTQETFTVGGAVHCTTCASEIVATVNDGTFRDGECGGCEYQRYRSQPVLLAFAGSARAAFEGLLSSLTEERRSVLRGGGTEEDCRDIDDRIARLRRLIADADAVIVDPAVTGPVTPLPPTQDGDQ